MMILIQTQRNMFLHGVCQKAKVTVCVCVFWGEDVCVCVWQSHKLSFHSLFPLKEGLSKVYENVFKFVFFIYLYYMHMCSWF